MTRKALTRCLGKVSIKAQHRLCCVVEVAEEYSRGGSAGTRALVAGLVGEPTHLIVKEDNTLNNIGIVDGSVGNSWSYLEING